MSFIENARLRGIAWLRERREAAAERRLERQDPPGVSVPLWLVQSARMAAWIAMATLVYFLWIFTLDIAGDQAVPLHVTHAGQWVGDLSFFFPLIVGFVFIAIGVPFMAKIIIPIFVSLDWRTNLWPKLWSLFLVLTFSAVVFAGTFSVQGRTILEHGRVSAVAVAQVGQNRAQLQSQIDGITADLNTMFNNRNAYMAQAASVGAARWSSTYIPDARRENDGRLPMIERALGAAQAADDARARRDVLRAQLASAPVVESVQANVATAGTSWISTTLDWLVGARAILLSLVMDIVCLLMPWIALRLEQVRNRQMGMVGGIAQHAYMLHDKRNEPATAHMSAQAAAYEVLNRGGTSHEAAEAARAAVRPAPLDRDEYDHDTGEKLIKVKGHLRKPTGKTKKAADGKLVHEMQIPGAPVTVTHEGRTFETAGVDEEASGDGGVQSHLHGEHEPLAPVDDVIPSADSAPDEQRHNAPEQEPQPENVDQVAEFTAHSEPPISDEDEAAALNWSAVGESAASDDSAEGESPNEEHVSDGSAPSAELPADVAADPIEDAAVDYPLQHDEPLDQGIAQAFANGRDRAEKRPERLLELEAAK